jgi:hypothetical protein
MIESKCFRLKDPLTAQQAKHLGKLLGGRFFLTNSTGEQVYEQTGIQQVLIVYYHSDISQSKKMAIELMLGTAVS